MTTGPSFSVIIAAYQAAGTIAEAIESALAQTPGVLQHNDLGTWNVVVQNGDFTVLDWESTRRHGLPLWDLWYFLMDAEAHLSGASTLDEREEHFAQLFGGRSAASHFLFRWRSDPALGPGWSALDSG